MQRKKILLVLTVAAGSALSYQLAHSQKRTEDAANGIPEQIRSGKTREFTLVNLEYEGTKIWLPSVLVVKKGDHVKLKLINNAPSGEHGFSIAEFKVVERVFKGEPRTVEFVADKAGLFRIFCQLHPAHIGGQLLVLR